MKGGRVVRVRVSPKDCMSVIDVCAVLGITKEARFSFDQMASITLKTLIESARYSKLIPTRDGFEYLQMMEPFAERTPGEDRARKLHLTSVQERKEATPLIQDPMRESRRRRYEELKIRKLGDPLNFTEQDQLEFTPLVDEFYS